MLILIDICAAGFWGTCHQQAYFDARVFNSFSSFQ